MAERIILQIETITEYIKKLKNERQLHLKLGEPCLERGGNSSNFKGVLAEFLNTDIPVCQKPDYIDLCHACNNPKCSNPKHLYWGTRVENVRDAFDNGALNAWERMVNKYGLEEARKMQSRRGKAAWNKGYKKNVAEAEKCCVGL